MSETNQQEGKFYSSFGAADSANALNHLHSWSTRKELFLCGRVLSFTPDILTKGKSSFWKKILNDYNLYFNNNMYKIRQTRTMKDKFLRMYGRFLHENKPYDQLNEVERILYEIKCRKENQEKFRNDQLNREASGVRHHSSGVHSPDQRGPKTKKSKLQEPKPQLNEVINVNVNSGGAEGDSEDIEEEEFENQTTVLKNLRGTSNRHNNPQQENNSILHDPPIMPTQQGLLHRISPSLLQPQMSPNKKPLSNPQLSSSPERQRALSENSVKRSHEYATTPPTSHISRSSAAVLNTDPTSGYASIHFKLPPDVTMVNQRVESIEEDVRLIKEDISMIKSQLSMILNLLSNK